MRIFLAIATLAVVTLPVAPAPAAGPAPDRTCGLYTVNDLTGLFGGPDNFNGFMSGGPWSDPDATSVELSCRILRNGILAGYVQGTTGAPSSSAAIQVALAAYPPDVVEVCTDLVVTGGPNAGSFTWDADPATAGVQCEVAAHIVLGPVQVRMSSISLVV